MATKTLSISEEAYMELKKLKQKGESFSQVILRLTRRKGDPEFILETVEALLDKDKASNEDLANSIEQVYKARKSRNLRRIDL